MSPNLMLARCVAYLLDMAVLFLVLAPAGWLVQKELGLEPRSGPQVWVALLLNFSVPTWVYFTVADASNGSTLGKRWRRLRVTDLAGQRLTLARATLRTAVKVIPWELTHVSAFALSHAPDQFTLVQWVGIVAANALILAYVALAWWSRGARSVHDYAAGTEVLARRVLSAGAPAPGP